MRQSREHESSQAYDDIEDYKSMWADISHQTIAQSQNIDDEMPSVTIVNNHVVYRNGFDDRSCVVEYAH